MADWDRRFDAFLNASHHRVRDAIAALGMSWDQVDDVAQEAYLTLYRKGPQLPADTDLLAWTIVTARNLTRNLWRKQQRHDALFSLLEGDAAAQADAVDDGLRLRALRTCLETLDAQRRSLLEQYYVTRSCAALAAEVGRTLIALRRAVQRSRDQVRLCVEQRLRQSDPA